MVEFLVTLRNNQELRSILVMGALVIAMLLALAEWKSSPFVSVSYSVVGTSATLLASCIVPCNMGIHAQGEESSTAKSMLSSCIHIGHIPAEQRIDTC